MRRKKNSCHSSSLLFSLRNAHISRFLHLISASCCRETSERKIISTNACDAGADRRSKASGPVSLYVVILCNRNSIPFSVSKIVSVSSVGVQLALHCFPGYWHWTVYRLMLLQYSCLQLICQETEFLGEACLACSGVK